AVMAAIQEMAPEVEFEIFTRVPKWFFLESLRSGFIYHDLLTDIGIVQSSPMHEQIPDTIERLGRFLPFDPKIVDSLAAFLRQRNCTLIVCDVAALGILVANQAGIPSVLIENFTWDWIYEGYLPRYPGFEPAISFLGDIYRQVTHHIQTEPVCQLKSTANLLTSPVSRFPRLKRRELRARLDGSDEQKVVLITMGGIQERVAYIDQLRAVHPNVRFIIPGASQRTTFLDNLILLPHHSEFYHPDLIFASDVVIGKAGYSTIAETYHAGLPFGFTSRPGFRESAPLSEYIQREFYCREFNSIEFLRGDWISHLLSLLEMPRLERNSLNGAHQIAKYLTDLLKPPN
ncbi:MAG: hypothetical protein U1B80_02375, partial [Anaerolineaceae bacterium]|nr:hypothetical protein [Anaerolineaceae bacterium]